MKEHVESEALGGGPDEQMVVDPVCGMSIDRETAIGTWDYKGTRYYFCNPSCLERFKADPEEFLTPKPGDAAEPGATYVCPMDPEVRQDHPGACPKCGMALEPDLSTLPATRVEYTCPMHPEIVRDQPGFCPICGMALEPRTVTLEETPNPELIDMTRRFTVAAALGAPVFLLTMGDMVLGLALFANRFGGRPSKANHCNDPRWRGGWRSPRDQKRKPNVTSTRRAVRRYYWASPSSLSDTGSRRSPRLRSSTRSSQRFHAYPTPASMVVNASASAVSRLFK